MLPTQYTLEFALDLWQESQKKEHNYVNREKYLDIALRLYVIPKIEPNIGQLTKAELINLSKSLMLDKFVNALAIFDTEFAMAVEKGQTSESTSKNYRAALKSFLNLLEKQPWWKGLLISETVQVLPTRKKLPPKSKKKRGPLVRRSLDKQSLPDYLKKELEEYQEFRLTGGTKVPRVLNQSKQEYERGFIRRPKLEPIKPSTFQKEKEKILYFLGWYSQNHPDSELHLKLLTDLDLLEDFIYWVIDNREVTHSTAIRTTDVAISIAKWLNYHQVKRRNWSDISLILDLRDLKNQYYEEYQEERKFNDIEKWDKKELGHEELRQISDYLKNLCAEFNSINIKRNGKIYQAKQSRDLSAIIRAQQTFLFVKILVYCPIRQEEIRNWIFNKSLFRYVDERGNPYYVVNLDIHKKDKSGLPRHYPLPDILTADLDVWLFKWRPLVVELLQTLEGWMTLWGYPLDIVEKHHNRIEKAKKGIVRSDVKAPPEVYIQEQEKRLAGVQYRLDAWTVAQENLEKHNRVFFSFGKKDAVAFGQTLDVSIFWQIVCRATAIASYELFGEAKWVNPHAFRHIAEKHLRLLGKSDVADAFGALIGHSKEMGDEYANQILSEYDITKDIVNNWWL